MDRFPEINTDLAAKLIASQFPAWKHLPVTRVFPGGHDNRTFRLGSEMLIRIPSAMEYSYAVARELHWLPQLAPRLPVQIPKPLAVGMPAEGLPWVWSVYQWLEGTPANSGILKDQNELAAQLGNFLKALHETDTTGGPVAGEHNFYRGGPLQTYDAQTRKAIADLGNRLDSAQVSGVWECALRSSYRASPVWVHGDISAGNLLLSGNRLSAVIDFGQLGIGDPACDLAIAWSFFQKESRDVFRKELSPDEGTWDRARGWALWKFLMVASGRTNWDAPEARDPWKVINNILTEFKFSS